MSRFNPSDPDFERRVRQSFGEQRIMQTLGASITRVMPGETVIELDYGAHLTQQHGYLHAGVVTTIADSACGYAAYTLMPALSEVLSVEFKTNFLSPARGNRFVATGQVIKPGRTLTICKAEVVAHDDNETRLVLIMQATMICIQR
jgi:uncharacterized protein (TIGR00369 family)